MSPPPDVYISLTSIPSRCNALKTTVQHLLQQDYVGIKGIVVTVPLVNLRGIPFESADDWSWITRDSYTSRNVILHRPAFDYGPCMKYVGMAPFLPKDNDNVWVFVCDDNKHYRSTRVSDLVLQIRNKKRVIASPAAVFGLEAFGNGMFSPLGFKGVLIHKEGIFKLERKLTRRQVPLCCSMNDDVMIGIMLHQCGYSFTRDRKHAPSAVFVDNSGVRTNSLHRTYDGDFQKYKDMYRCQVALNRKNVVNVWVIVCFGVLFFLVLLVAVPVIAIRCSRKR